MNDNFNIQRFWKYFSTELKDMAFRHGPALLMFSLVPLYMFLLYLIGTYALKIEGWQLHLDFESQMTAFITGTAFSLIFPILCYGKVTDRKKGTDFLMLPASRMEKFTSMILISIVIAPAVFGMIYLASDFVLSAAFPSCFDYNGTSLAEKAFTAAACAFTYNEEFNAMTVLWSLNLFLPFAVSSAGLAGGLVFKRSKMSKTFLCCIILTLILFGLVTKAVDIYKDGGPMDMKCVTIMNWFWYGGQAAAMIGFLAIVYYRTGKIEL